jgi:predicted NAD-dependent protein-ADP-ribosyltransferase YbiA (DUF1768 family)
LLFKLLSKFNFFSTLTALSKLNPFSEYSNTDFKLSGQKYISSQKEYVLLIQQCASGLKTQEVMALKEKQLREIAT